eukprot:Rhum_TRINITY_DN10056_c0_g1::Rhum_TRINITY_DN10056_c0_g1_i1::g.36581::m.36581
MMAATIRMTLAKSAGDNGLRAVRGTALQQRRSAGIHRPNGAPKVAVFLDSENITTAKVQLALGILSNYGDTVVSKAYGKHCQETKRILSRLDFEFITTGEGAEAADVRLAFDAAREAQRGEVAVIALLTGDSDFVPLAKYIKSKGVIVHSFQEKQRNFAHAADYVHSLGMPSGARGDKRDRDVKDAAAAPTVAVPVEEWKPTPPSQFADALMDRFFTNIDADFVPPLRTPQALGSLSRQRPPTAAAHRDPEPSGTQESAPTAPSVSVRAAAASETPIHPSEFLNIPPSDMPLMRDRKKAPRKSDGQSEQQRDSDRLELARRMHRKMVREQEEEAAAGDGAADAAEAAEPSTSQAESESDSGPGRPQSETQGFRQQHAARDISQKPRFQRSSSRDSDSGDARSRLSNFNPSFL